MNKISLRDKFFGCMAGSHIGSAMGAPVEGFDWQDIEDKFGLLESFQSYHHYGDRNDWIREPGTTEDGIERQKLMITAIMEKGDRITAQDLKHAWVKHMNPNAGGVISEPFETALLEIAKTPVPGSQIGTFCDYSGLVSFARGCHPIGLINAGDIEGAVRDTMDVGMIYHAGYTRALYWGLVVTVGIAAATKPDATVERVIQTVLEVIAEETKREFKYVSGGLSIPDELNRALEVGAKCTNLQELRMAFDKHYSGKGMQYGMSQANEIVSKGLAIFSMVKGNTKDAILTSINMGRDTDCLAAVAAGLCGALTGADSIPEEWIKQCDYAASINQHTSTRRTLNEHTDGLYKAFQNRISNLKTYNNLMGEYAEIDKLIKT